jgi:hypothetical protein
MKKMFIAVICIVTTSKTYAQDLSSIDTKNSFKINNFIDLSLGSNGKSNIGSFSVGHLWGLGKRKQWRVGGGLRYSSFFSNKPEHEFYSARPDFYRVNEKMDTVKISHPQQNNIVLFLEATYRIKGKIELGFNIDLFGYAFGASKSGKFIGSNSSIPITTNVSANSISYLIYDIYDVGMIKAEFMIGYWLNKNWLVRGGLSDFLIEYKTPTELQKDNKRFKDLIYVPFIAIRYSPKHN